MISRGDGRAISAGAGKRSGAQTPIHQSCAQRVHVQRRVFHYERGNNKAMGSVRPSLATLIRTTELTLADAAAELRVIRGGRTQDCSDTNRDAPPLTCTPDELPPANFADISKPSATTLLPPVLWSLPGSGSTMTRQLIDLAAGVYTGSKYYDRDLARLLPGERLDVRKCCGNCSRLSLIKVHPGVPDDRLNVCAGKIMRAILLVRHPLRAAWSEFQRMAAQAGCFAGGGGDVSPASKTMGHVATIPLSQWTPELRAQWLAFHPPFLSKWAAVWRPNGAYDDFLVQKISKRGTGNLSRRALVLRFETLHECDTTVRTAALRSVLNFMRVGKSKSQRHIDCAFAALQHDSVRRAMKRPRDERSSVSATLAYGGTVGSKAWALVADVATLFGYECGELCDDIH